ncbi:hypothetical protein MKW92_001255, partial [Papaver armeniacum]
TRDGAKMVKVQEMDLVAANGNGQFPGEKAFEDMRDGCDRCIFTEKINEGLIK